MSFMMAELNRRGAATLAMALATGVLVWKKGFLAPAVAAELEIRRQPWAPEAFKPATAPSSRLALGGENPQSCLSGFPSLY
jgi:hypothetical protein